MKTIIKVPLYVEITSEDGGDRKLIAETTRSVLSPEIMKLLKELVLPNFTGSSKRNFRDMLGSKASFTFLSENDIFFRGVEQRKTDESHD